MDAPAELTEMLAAGERAAFHGPPDGAVQTLEAAVLEAQRQGRTAEATAAAWLLGVALGAAGRFGGALTVLAPLVEAALPATGPEARLFGALAAATMASVHRQLGRHDDARAHDERGLGIAGGFDEAVFDCHLGLASDAVGLADPAAARGHLAAATALLDGHDDWWRQRVRAAWAQAELALLEQAPAPAVQAAAGAVETAEGARAPRHVAKGLLFQGVAQLQAGHASAAESALRRAATLAESLGALPLVWRARALLGALVSDAAESARSLAAARAAVRRISADLPPALAGAWLTQPDVAALLEADRA